MMSESTPENRADWIRSSAQALINAMEDMDGDVTARKNDLQRALDTTGAPETPPRPDRLDPGISEIVTMLRSNGFHTTDSGDGVSKVGTMECAIPVPNVAIRVSHELLFSECDRLQHVLDADWCIQGSYDPHDGSTVILATKDREARNG